MSKDETPSSVLYGLLRALRISNKEAAQVLLTDELSFGGKIPRDRIGERTYLHRVVHAQPGEYPEMYFTDLATDALVFCSRAVGEGSPVRTMEALVGFLSGEEAAVMAEALAAHGQDGVLFSNLIRKIAKAGAVSDADRASLMMLAYLAAGCYGDVARAVELVEGFQPSLTAHGFRTELAGDVADGEGEGLVRPGSSAPVKLGLVRVVDGALDLGSIHDLSTAPEGTVIGSMATEASSITDVGTLVSRRHLRVYRDADGSWHAQGLGSTNGTTLIRGSDKMEVLVEAPKVKRTAESAPVPLLPGDALCLAGTTVFLAMVVR